MEATNSNTCGCGNHSDGNANSEKASEKEQSSESDAKIAGQITWITSESEKAWRRISEKQLVISGLRGEQIKISDKFARYYEIGSEVEHAVCNDSSSSELFNEVNEQVKKLSQLLSEFESELKMSEKNLEDLIHEMRAHFINLRKWIENVQGADDGQQKEHFLRQCPSLNWINMIQDPEVEKLAAEWETMQLDDKMTQQLVQIETLANLSGINLPSKKNQ